MFVNSYHHHDGTLLQIHTFKSENTSTDAVCHKVSLHSLKRLLTLRLRAFQIPLTEKRELENVATENLYQPKLTLKIFLFQFEKLKSQVLLWWTKHSLDSINIWGEAREAWPLCSAYPVPSLVHISSTSFNTVGLFQHVIFSWAGLYWL